MSKQYFKITIKYDNNCGGTDTQLLYAYENNSHDYMTIVTENGENPSCSGTDWYCNALGYALLLENNDDTSNSTIVEECGWMGLPENIQKVFDYQRYRKEHPLKLYEYPENSPIKIYRVPIPDKISDIESWLELGCQPFDFILEDPDIKDGTLLVPPKACPICGSRKVKQEGYNDLNPYALAGSAGYIVTCENCGYTHREVTTMS